MIFRHLLPNSRAWRLIIGSKIREFFDGLSTVNDDITLFFDLVWLDIFPQTTRELQKWETQFGLLDTGITTQQRRDRLTATWQAFGGQDPQHIQNTLQSNGFDVYIHEWWTPGTEPTVNIKSCVTPRDPFTVLRLSAGVIEYTVLCGEAVAQCGEGDAVAGDRVGVAGYPLVNKLTRTEPELLSLAGESFMKCGEAGAICGDFVQFIDVPIVYKIPSDSNTWSYFLYIGGVNFGDIAQIDPKRRDEFETLCLKICPAQNWLGIIAEYI